MRKLPVLTLYPITPDQSGKFVKARDRHQDKITMD
jgi:hypothetical protein